MSDLWLCWFQIEARPAVVARGELAQVCAEIGLEMTRSVGDGKAAAFRAACRTRLTYTDDSGASHVVTGRLLRKSGEQMLYIIEREDGIVFAEWKFFQSQRDRGAIKAGLHLTKAQVRSSLPSAEKALFEQWLQEAKKVLDADATAAAHLMIRNQVTDTLDGVATPLMQRLNFYFGYDEDYETASRVAAFLERTMPGQHNFTLVRISPQDSGSSAQMFAKSADLHLSRQLADPILSMTRASQDGATSLAAHRLKAYAELNSIVRFQARTHEHRLDRQLPETTRSLEVMQELLQRCGHGLPAQRSR